MAKNLVDGTNIIIEENADNINLNLSSTYNNAMLQTIQTQIINNNVYESNETVIGTWTNGKPIYRKVFVNQTSDNSNLYINHNLTDLDYFWLETNACFVFDYNESLPSNWYYSSSDWSRHWMNKTQIRFRNPGNIGSRLLYTVINYTKTTD